jgi:hypothetical protein
MLSGKGIDLLNILIERKTNKNSTTAPTLASKRDAISGMDRTVTKEEYKKITHYFKMLL